MNVVSKRGLMRLVRDARVDSETARELERWYHVARGAGWTGLVAVRETFPDADQVGRVLIFNIRHNRHRLITFVVYGKQRLYVKALLNHKEYERGEWKKWA